MDALISEKDVETKIIHPLFHDILGYPDESLNYAKSVKITLGREKKTKQTDLVVSHKGKRLIVVEAKRPTEPVQTGFEQADSYAFALETPYSLITNGKSLVLRGYYSFNTKINIIEDQIEELKKDDWKRVKDLISYANILASIEPANKVAQPNPERIKNYRRYFRRIHDEIRDGDKLDPVASFDELSKILFLKAAEEEWITKNGGQTVLSMDKVEEFEKIGKGLEYVNDWFAKATREFYPEIFEEHTKINLSLNTIKHVLGLMGDFHIKNGEVDIKGRAYEEFLPSQLRGKGLGQYFTPRRIVNFMVDLAELSIYDTVVDFACGSGGFLIKAYERMKHLTDMLPDGTWQRLGITKDSFFEDIKQRQIYGIDAEPRAARTAKMNMLMWGDGKRVVRGNALDTKDFNGNEYSPQEYDTETGQGGCSLILANPPFGGAEKNQEILKRYKLGSRDYERKSQRTEILFLEKGLKLLKPQGRMLIILPQGILSNKDYEYVRDYIHSQAEIRAIVTLPTHSFVQSGVQIVKTCILYLQKFTPEKKKLYDDKTKNLKPEQIRKHIRLDDDFDYRIFFGSAEFIGFEPSGRSIVKPGEKTDLDLLLEDSDNENLTPSQNIDLLEFAERYYNEKPLKRAEQTIRGTERGLKTSFFLKLSDTEERLDTAYYYFRAQTKGLIDTFSSIDGSVTEVKSRFRPQTDEEKDSEYPILTVSNDGKVSLNEYRKGEEFTQSYKKVKAGDIAYNPYRVNIGSIGVVPPELDGAYVSPAYVVFRMSERSPVYLVDLLRAPFYKLYIDVVATGSIRDSLAFSLLRNIKIPKLTPEQENQIANNIESIDGSILELDNSVETQKSKRVDEIHGILRGYMSKKELPKQTKEELGITQAQFHYLLDKASQPLNPKSGQEKSET